MTSCLDNSADEDSEYSEECSAPSPDRGRTVFYPDLYVLTMSIGLRRRKHTSMQPQLDHFVL